MTLRLMEMRQHLLQFLHAVTQRLHLSEGVGLIVLSAALYGLTMVVSKGVLEHLPPITLLTIQTASSVSLFWTIVGFQGIQVPFKWEALKVGLPGLLEPGLAYLVGMFGLAQTTASNATFISTMEPVMTIALSWLVLKERVSKSLIALGGIACLGVALVANPETTSNAQASLWGDGLLLLNVLFASLYSLTTARAIERVPAVLLAAMQQSFALLFFLIMMILAALLHLETITFTPETWVSLGVAIASGAFGYGTAFLLYLAALRYQSAGRISVYLTLIPIFGVLSAYVLLGEQFSLWQGLGGALIVGATFKISRMPHPVT